MYSKLMHTRLAQHTASLCTQSHAYLGCLLGPDREALCARGKLIKALASVDLSWNALREESALSTFVTKEDDVQSLKAATKA